MPTYNIAQFLTAGRNVITFTPTQTGNVRFTCGMGMFSGNFNVVD
jgi:plastocyanin domain-containing protein